MKSSAFRITVAVIASCLVEKISGNIPVALAVAMATPILLRAMFGGK